MTLLIDESPTVSLATRGANVAPALIGVFLLATAWLKVLAPAEAARVQTAYDFPKWLLTAGIHLELVVGLLLVAQIWRPWTWGAAVALFASFAGVALLRAVVGLESCGCFGVVRVNPWLTFAIDVAILAVLLLRRESFVAASVSTTPHWKRAWLAAWPIMAIASTAMLVANRPERLAASTPLLADERLVVLEPSEWIGQTLPLGPYLRPQPDLSVGRWIIVLYHHDCGHCQEALPQYELLARDRRAAAIEGILAVEVPPFGPEQSGQTSALTQARLSKEREWFVQAPVEIELKDGVVVGSSLDLPSIRQTGDVQRSRKPLQ